MISDVYNSDKYDYNNNDDFDSLFTEKFINYCSSLSDSFGSLKTIVDGQNYSSSDRPINSS